jgi:hypothetical protein
MRISITTSAGYLKAHPLDRERAGSVIGRGHESRKECQCDGSFHSDELSKTLFIQSRIAKDYRYLSYGSHNIENDKY